MTGERGKERQKWQWREERRGEEEMMREES